MTFLEASDLTAHHAQWLAGARALRTETNGISSRFAKSTGVFTPVRRWI